MGTVGGRGDAFGLCAAARRVGHECEIAIGQDTVCSGGVRDRTHRRHVARGARAFRRQRRFSLRPIHGSRRVLLPGRVPISNLRRSTRRRRRRVLSQPARVTRDARMGCGCGHRAGTSRRATDKRWGNTSAEGAVNDVLAAWRDRIKEAASARTPLRLVGGGTKDFYGQELVGERFDTTTYAGVVDYDPTELVITARCGTPLAEVERTLAEGGQMLGFEPPRFGDAATLGGCIAAGVAGPPRPDARGRP